jgi:hypothetical protein
LRTGGLEDSDSISKLTNLASLGIWRLYLTEIPEVILPSLKSLTLHDFGDSGMEKPETFKSEKIEMFLQ